MENKPKAMNKFEFIDQVRECQTILNGSVHYALDDGSKVVLYFGIGSVCVACDLFPAVIFYTADSLADALWKKLESIDKYIVSEKEQMEYFL